MHPLVLILLRLIQPNWLRKRKPQRPSTPASVLANKVGWLMGKPPPAAMVWGVRGCCPVANSKGWEQDWYWRMHFDITSSINVDVALIKHVSELYCTTKTNG
ncbi:hypothetical protein QL285_019356 [Trifolium repens]|nr:hypothetical protein QL285_019356 [Trifolium repens]